MVIEKPKLVYQVKVERRKYIRRFFWNMLTVITAVGAVVALNRAESIPQLDRTLLLVGQVVALGVGAMYLVRGVFALLRGLQRRDETIRLFDRGFAWTRKGETEKYSWSQLESHREAFRSLKIGRFNLFQSGRIMFKMKDGNTYSLTPIHGDLSQISRRIAPFIADITGTTMGRALRNGQKIALHPDLVVAAQGIVAKKEKIRWKDVDIDVKGKNLIVSRKTPTGKFKPVAKYPVARVENLGGFLDIARSTIQNHQPQRFGIQPKVGMTYTE